PPFWSRMIAETWSPLESVMGSTVGAGFCSTLGVKLTAAEAGAAKVTAMRSTERNNASFFMGNHPFRIFQKSIYLSLAHGQDQIPSLGIACQTGGQHQHFVVGGDGDSA